MPNSSMGTVAADTIFIFPDVYLGGKMSIFVLLIMKNVNICSINHDAEDGDSDHDDDNFKSRLKQTCPESHWKAQQYT